MGLQLIASCIQIEGSIVDDTVFGRTRSGSWWQIIGKIECRVDILIEPSIDFGVGFMQVNESPIYWAISIIDSNIMKQLVDIWEVDVNSMDRVSGILKFLQ